jgi:hypothetical protein
VEVRKGSEVMHTLEHSIILSVWILILIEVCTVALQIHDYACIEILHGIWLEQDLVTEEDIRKQLKEQVFYKNKVTVSYQNDIATISYGALEKKLQLKKENKITRLQRYKVILDGAEVLLQKGS